MTNDTSYRQKGRAVFLAAIMVLSMVAMSAALAGSAAASHDGSAYDIEIDGSNGERVWQGQTIQFSLDNGTTYDVTGPDGGDLGSFTTNNSTGIHRLDSSSLSATGDYEVHQQGGGLAANFTLTEQTLSASFDDPINTGQNATLTVDTNRPNTHDVVVSSDDADVDTVFGDENQSVTGGLGTVTTLNPDTSGLSAGNYTFTFDAHDSDASTTATLVVEEAAAGTADITPGSVSEEVGDVATFSIETSGTYTGDTIYVQATDENNVLNYTFSTTVDGSAAINFNSFQAVHNNTLAFTSDDVTLNEEDNSSTSIAPARLQPSRVNLRVYADDPTTNANAEQLDRGFIRLQQRSLDSATTYTAPGSTNLGALNASELVGASTQRSDVADGDYLIAQFQGSGLYGYMVDDNGDFDPNSQNLSLSIQSTEDPAYGQPAGVTIETGDPTDENGVEAFMTDAENDQFFLVVNPNALDGAGDITASDLQTGTSWEADFTIGEDNPYVTADDSVNTTFDYTERSLQFDMETNENDFLQVPNGANQSVSGTSTAAPGTQVSVSAFFDTEILDGTAEVQEDGTWSATLGDLSGYETGNQFTIQAQETDTLNTGGTASNTGESDAMIASGGEGPAQPSFTVEASDNGPVEVDGSGTLDYTITNNGDAAGTVNYTVTVGGEEVDTGSEELEPGNSTSGTYEDFDTSEAGDISYEVTTEAGDDSASGSLTVEEAGNGTDTGTTDETDGTDGNDSDDGDGGGQPGFGLVVALFALIGAALLALRRQN